MSLRMNMFDNFKNLVSMLSQAKQLQGRLAELQEELARKTVQADAGAGAVRATVNGKLEVVAIQFDTPLLATLAGEGSAADRQMIEDLTAAAVNAALAKAKKMAQQEMARVTGGLHLPGLEGLLPPTGL